MSLRSITHAIHHCDVWWGNNTFLMMHKNLSGFQDWKAYFNISQKALRAIVSDELCFQMISSFCISESFFKEFFVSQLGEFMKFSIFKSAAHVGDVANVVRACSEKGPPVVDKYTPPRQIYPPRSLICPLIYEHSNFRFWQSGFPVKIIKFLMILIRISSQNHETFNDFNKDFQWKLWRFPFFQ